MTKLYLDIDGVICPYGHPGVDALWPTTWSTPALGSCVEVIVNNDLIAALCDLDVDVIWATTWIDSPDELHQLEEHLGLPALDRIPYLDARITADCGKREGVLAHLGDSTEPVIWLDDAIGPNDLFWAEMRNEEYPTLALRINAVTGITPDTLVTLTSWLDNL